MIDERNPPADDADPLLARLERSEKRQGNGHGRNDGVDEIEPESSEFDNPIAWVALESQTPPARRWILDDWIGAGHVTSLYGRGGVGKSLMGQQIATQVCGGDPVFGIATEQGRVLALFCEDDLHELWRRQVRINAALGKTMAHIRGFDAFARLGQQNALIRTDRSSGLVIGTGLYFNLIEHIRLCRIAGEVYNLVILDNIAQMISVNGNDQNEVTQAINLLTAMAIAGNLAILLTGHPSRGINSEFSGSVAWENAIRSRLYLSRKQNAEGKEDESGETFLSRNKANYAGKDSITLRYDAGVFRRIDGAAVDQVERIRRDVADRRAAEAIVNGIRILAQRNLDKPTDASRSPDRYLPKMLATHMLLGESTIEAVKAAVPKAIAEGVIVRRTAQDTAKGRNFSWLELPTDGVPNA